MERQQVDGVVADGTAGGRGRSAGVEDVDEWVGLNELREAAAACDTFARRLVERRKREA
jgi:hypothetical protein